MKLIIAIVQDEDAARLVSNLMNEGYSVTKLATTGGFLMAGNVTILVGVDEETMFKMTEALGLGMGCMDGTCGAVAGACILAGMKRSTGNLEKPDSKAESYKLSRAILGGFEKANGTAICKELKGIETGKVIKSCDDCIKEAAALAEQVLFS